MPYSYKRLDEDVSEVHKILATERDQTEAECEKASPPPQCI